MALLTFFDNLLDIYLYLILARVLLSWFPNARRNPIVQILHKITDPIMLPLQRLNLRAGMFDFRAIAAIILLQILQFLIHKLISFFPG